MESNEERVSQPVNTSLCVLHSLDHSETFTELYREETREKGDRGGQEDKRGGMKRRETDPASNQSPHVFSTVWNTHRFTELGREEKGEGGDRGDLVEKKENTKWERALKSVISLPSKNGY